MERSVHRKAIQESIDEMSIDELKTSCFEFAEDYALLKESTGFEIDEEIPINELMCIFKKQGITWLIQHLSSMQTNNTKFTVQAFIEIITEHAKLLDSVNKSTINTLH